MQRTYRHSTHNYGISSHRICVWQHFSMSYNTYIVWWLLYTPMEHREPVTCLLLARNTHVYFWSAIRMHLPCLFAGLTHLSIWKPFVLEHTTSLYTVSYYCMRWGSALLCNLLCTLGPSIPHLEMKRKSKGNVDVFILWHKFKGDRYMSQRKYFKKRKVTCSIFRMSTLPGKVKRAKHLSHKTYGTM